MATKKSRINGYKIKRFLFLFILLSILASAFWAVLKRVSPVFKPPEIRSPIERDYRGAIKIDIKADLSEDMNKPEADKPDSK